MSNNAKSYKDTIFLPDTTFPMRGDLTTKEPARLEKWENEKLYERITARRKAQNAPKFVLHDGPPFANGDVHMGTALNKTLKDLIIKSKTMAGFYAPFVPGWDCHGLPIEAKVVKEFQGLEPAEIRRRCMEFALGYIDQQRVSFRRLGIFGDWFKPYITMMPEYECHILRVFAKLVESGAVYQSLKPVQWSYAHHTALAEAEVEYMEDTSTAIYVAFKMTEPVQGIDNCEMVIWTTTPWTLPSNLAIALHPDFTYIIGRYAKDGATRNFIVVKELIETFTAKTGWVLETELGSFKGSELEKKNARHPFLDRDSLIINAEYVTTDTGTGAVHIAPGHGMDDYIAGMQYGLPVLSPVDDDGNYTAECGVPSLVGQHVFKSNEAVIEMLVAGDRLLGREEFTHQYPHCWRSKTPIIFRAVKQFFISMEKLRPLALTEIDKTKWVPAWGRNRIYSTVEARPDWCISRQRTWGVPLPVFFDAEDKPVLDADIIRKVADLVEEKGTNIWFELSDEELCAKLGLPAGLRKGKDTLDVWIDSGCSHVAVLENHPELCAPCDVYLEATDQHRGWFQSSLMLSCAWRGTAPYKQVLTHAFVVNQDRSKLSKSAQGTYQKPTNAKYFYEKYGADIVRLWVSSVDWQNEVPFGEDLFKQITDPYRRLRNTLRILLANLKGYEGQKPATISPLDAWILERSNSLIREVRAAYESFEFRKVFMAINQFCTNDLSALYIDITKDSLYCDAADSDRRISKQFAIARVFDVLVKLLAPILAYTCDEAWEHAGHTDSVHEQDFPTADAAFDAGVEKTFERLLQIKSTIYVAIQAQIQAKAFNKNNEAAVSLTITENEDPAVVALLEDADFAKEFFIIASLSVTKGSELTAVAAKTPHAMCPRCRRYEPTNEEGLCARCADIV